jgi:hypothetical protein
VNYASYAFAEMGEVMDFTVSLLLAGLIACCACRFACRGICVAWVRAGTARRRRRAEIALRADVTRGLAEIERFLEAHAARAIPGNPPDTGSENKNPS